ncbi:MAG: DUF2857 domain-containing protein [Gammaproteobacteria bacterium]
MIGTKEADLVTAVLLYAMRCLAEGDQHALRAMRFGPREIEALRELNLADLYRVGALQAHCLSIALDREVFWPMIANLRASREAEELQRDLIQADAPLEMMRSLFGVGSREYTRLRRMLAVDPAVGRPPEPDEETGHRLWRALSARLESVGEEALDPKEYLAVQEESGASMRAVWNLVQRWLEYGDVYVPSDTVSSSQASPPPEQRAAGGQPR